MWPGVWVLSARAGPFHHRAIWSSPHPRHEAWSLGRRGARVRVAGGQPCPPGWPDTEQDGAGTQTWERILSVWGDEPRATARPWR